MVFQTACMLAVFAAKNDTVRDVVLTGSLTVMPQIEDVIRAFSQLTDMSFSVPPHPVFATAIGAVLI
jgi:type II pantothenate kinase